MNRAASLSRRQPAGRLAPSWVTLDPMLADDFPRG